MKIYFAGSIRGGRQDAVVYQSLISMLKSYGTVFTEHVGDSSLTDLGDEGYSDQYIHDRDLGWIEDSDFVVAEVTTASLGVGYEIGRAVAAGKKVLCLFRQQPGKRLSAMIAGCPGLTIRKYEDTEDAEDAISGFFKSTPDC